MWDVPQPYSGARHVGLPRLILGLMVLPTGWSQPDCTATFAAEVAAVSACHATAAYQATMSLIKQWHQESDAGAPQVQWWMRKHDQHISFLQGF